MPTDILAVMTQRQAQRSWAAQEEAWLLIVPVLICLLTVALSIRSPAFAAIVICVGMQ